MQKLAKEQECRCVIKEKLSAGEVFDQASNKYMALYYHCVWCGGHLSNVSSLGNLTSQLVMNLVGCCVILAWMFPQWR